MNQSVLNGKCLVFCLLSFELSTATVFGGTGAGTPELSKGTAAYSRSLTDAENQRALEAYEKRNAEITAWPEDGVPANTDNAALLYYQACLFRPEPNEALRYKIRPNAGSTPQIRTYLGHCLPVIEMLETASRIPGCTWAVWPEGGLSRMPWRREIGFVTNILLLDATTLAVDGHYRVALERCLTVRRIARHLSDDPELCLFETGPDVQALYAIKVVLGMMPPDADILTWFRDRFAVVPGPRLSFAMTLHRKVRVQLEGMRTYPDHLRSLRDMALREAKGQQAKENIRNLTDEQFRSRAREGLTQFTDSILEIIDSEATYEQKLSQVHGLCNEMIEDDATDPIVKGFISPSGMNMKGQIVLSYSRYYVEHEAHVNGTKAAVEIYLVLAKTGKLPEKLPDHLPKDPFTGRDFGYEITDEGFALRCQGERFKQQKKSLLEFRVRK